MRFIHTDQAPAAVGPYSQAVAAGGLLFISGQLGLNPATGQLAQGLEAQAAQALKNLLAILAAEGLDATALAAVDVYLADMADFKAFNEIYAKALDGHLPARAAVQVAALPLNARIEVKAVAVLP